VRIGIKAPESVSIERSEVAARKPELSSSYELLGAGI
jgi:sRNA-binding carbon storage regulator CsrA